MYLKQLKGPFSKKSSSIVIAPQNNNSYDQEIFEYVKIGIETPRTLTIRQISNDNRPSSSNLVEGDVLINGHKYHIPQTGILEYEGIKLNSITIQFLRDLPEETTIDIAYIIQDE